MKLLTKRLIEGYTNPFHSRGKFSLTNVLDHTHLKPPSKFHHNLHRNTIHICCCTDLLLTLSLRLHGGGDGLRTDVLPPSATEELSDSVLGVGEGPLGVWGLADRGSSWRGDGGGLCKEAGVGFGLLLWGCWSGTSRDSS